MAVASAGVMEVASCPLTATGESKESIWKGKKEDILGVRRPFNVLRVYSHKLSG